jgi:hypothetical protein
MFLYKQTFYFSQQQKVTTHTRLTCKHLMGQYSSQLHANHVIGEG